VYYEDLEKEVIETSPQIIKVVRDYWYDHIVIITPDNYILFFERFKRKTEK
jgi:hypothetical protein